jgi:hypothetical protein
MRYLTPLRANNLTRRTHNPCVNRSNQLRLSKTHIPVRRACYSHFRELRKNP